MSSINISACKKIVAKDIRRYNGIAFDGEMFYLLTDSECIAVVDKCYAQKREIKTARVYNSICFDFVEGVFWASALAEGFKLYKLDCNMCEIGCLLVPPVRGCGDSITAVSLDCCCDRLIVAFAHCVISLCKTDSTDYKVLRKSSATKNCGALAVSPAVILIERTDSCKQSLEIFSCSGSNTFAVPTNYCFLGIVFCPVCIERCYKFYILAVDSSGCSYILEWLASCGDIGVEIDKCNYMVCPCGGGESHESVSDIIESIALMEAALSHILNAEGEKLQKIIASTCNVDEILSANDSINETIINVTHLEIILHNKLKLASSLCKDCHNLPKCVDRKKCCASCDKPKCKKCIETPCCKVDPSCKVEPSCNNCIPPSCKVEPSCNNCIPPSCKVDCLGDSAKVSRSSSDVHIE